jgi:hypothetical protein
MMSALHGHTEYAIVALVGWIILYLGYKFAWRRDFGLPVRRRLLARRLVVERDQVAFVPFWWTDLQVQRAVNGYWKRTLKRSFEKPLLSREMHLPPSL